MISKTLIFTILCLAGQLLYAQKHFSINKVNELKGLPAGSASVFINNSNNIVFSSITSDGLYFYDVNKKTVETLNTDNGAGFQFHLAENGKTVVYKSYIMDASGRRQSSIYEQNIASKERKAIVEYARGLGSISYHDDNLLYMHHGKVEVHTMKTITSKSEKATAVFTDDDLNLVLLRNNQKVILNPLGNGNYIWVSLSPDRQKILFNKAGKGTFVCDLKAKITANLGRLHAAKWADDGNWIIGMNDFDDGQKYTSSQIVLCSVDGKKRQSLELKNHKIALFPDISSNYSKIVFNDEKGKLYIISLEK